MKRTTLWLALFLMAGVLVTTADAAGNDPRNIDSGCARLRADWNGWLDHMLNRSEQTGLAACAWAQAEADGACRAQHPTCPDAFAGGSACGACFMANARAYQSCRPLTLIRKSAGHRERVATAFAAYCGAMSGATPPCPVMPAEQRKCEAAAKIVGEKPSGDVLDKLPF